VKVRYGADTNVGLVRSHNEDSWIAQGPVFAVADGMGGHQAGEIASTLAVQEFAHAARDLDKVDSLRSPEQWLIATIQKANTAIHLRGAEQGGLLRMGTTLTAALVLSDKICIGHVGDSRAYLFNSNTLKQVTSDHSLVAEWVREGRITPEEAAIHPRRSVITRALGIDPQVEIDTYTVPVQNNDRLLLCSDGLTGLVSDLAIAEVLLNTEDPHKAVKDLIDRANEAGGDDNITVLLLNVTSNSAEKDETKNTAASKKVVSEETTKKILSRETMQASLSGEIPIPGESSAKEQKKGLPQVGVKKPEMYTANTGVSAPPRPEQQAEITMVLRPSSHSSPKAPPAEPVPAILSSAEEKPSQRTSNTRIAIFLVLFLVTAGSLWTMMRGSNDTEDTAGSSYYVGVAQGMVAIFEGTPDDPGKKDPTISSVPVNLLETRQRRDVEKGFEVDSLAEANQYIDSIETKTSGFNTSEEESFTPQPEPSGKTISPDPELPVFPQNSSYSSDSDKKKEE